MSHIDDVDSMSSFKVMYTTSLVTLRESGWCLGQIWSRRLSVAPSNSRDTNSSLLQASGHLNDIDGLNRAKYYLSNQPCC
jgi:hypothetical protein